MSTSLRSWRPSYTPAARAAWGEMGDQSTAGGTGAYDGTEATSTDFVAASMPETPPSCCTALFETWAGRAACTVLPSAGSDECDKEWT